MDSFALLRLQIQPGRGEHILCFCLIGAKTKTKNMFFVDWELVLLTLAVLCLIDKTVVRNPGLLQSEGGSL